MNKARETVQGKLSGEVEKELADLTIAIGLMNAYNRLAIGFRNPPKAAT